MRRKVVDAPLEVDRIVAHVRAGVEAYDPDCREDETGQIERPPMVPGDRRPEGDAHERGDEAARLRRLEPSPEGSHLFPDRLSSWEDPNFDQHQGPRPRVYHRVLLAVNQAGHGTGADFEGVPIRDDLALPLDEVEDLRVSEAEGRRRQS